MLSSETIWKKAMTKKTRRRYTAEFKAAAVARLEEPGETLSSVAQALGVHIFIDFGQLCSSKPTGRVHGNRTAVFMISTTCFQAGQHP